MRRRASDSPPQSTAVRTGVERHRGLPPEQRRYRTAASHWRWSSSPTRPCAMPTSGSSGWAARSRMSKPSGSRPADRGRATTSGEAVASIGVPVLGLQPDAQVLRRAECTLGDQRSLIESFWLWLWMLREPIAAALLAGRKRLAAAPESDENGRPVEVVAMVTGVAVGSEPRRRTPAGSDRPCEVTGGGRGSGRRKPTPPRASQASAGASTKRRVVLTGRRMPVARVGRLGRARRGRVPVRHAARRRRTPRRSQLRR